MAVNETEEKMQHLFESDRSHGYMESFVQYPWASVKEMGLHICCIIVKTWGFVVGYPKRTPFFNAASHNSAASCLLPRR